MPRPIPVQMVLAFVSRRVWRDLQRRSTVNVRRVAFIVLVFIEAALPLFGEVAPAAAQTNTVLTDTRQCSLAHNGTVCIIIREKVGGNGLYIEYVVVERVNIDVLGGICDWSAAVKFTLPDKTVIQGGKVDKTTGCNPGVATATFTVNQSFPSGTLACGQWYENDNLDEPLSAQPCATIREKFSIYDPPIPNGIGGSSALIQGILGGQLSDIGGSNAFIQTILNDLLKSLGVSPTTTTTTVPRARATQVSAGGVHSCAVVTAGLKCWGENSSGELGDGTTTRPGMGRTTPVDVIGSFGAAQVSVGANHTCALFSDRVKCWGLNSRWAPGQLGDGSTTDRSSPVDVVGISGATQVSSGFYHSCALVAGGRVRCWGSNESGELGDGTTTWRSTPVDVIGVSGAIQVSAGPNNTCALVAGGRVSCWGSNSSGELGDGTTTNRSTPADVIGISGATQISADGGHTCALLTGGTIRCWGFNYSSQLGDGTTTNRSTPVDVIGISGATQVSAGGAHTCALVVGGGVSCWGSNFYGQLGDGTTNDRPTPGPVSGIIGANQVSAGATNSTCAVVSGGIKCWGANESGQLGDGATINRAIPVAVSGIS